MTEKIYDVIVLGGGAGGVPAAIRAAQLGGPKTMKSLYEPTSMRSSLRP